MTLVHSYSLAHISSIERCSLFVIRIQHFNCLPSVMCANREKEWEAPSWWKLFALPPLCSTKLKQYQIKFSKRVEAGKHWIIIITEAKARSIHSFCTVWPINSEKVLDFKCHALFIVARCSWNSTTSTIKHSTFQFYCSIFRAANDSGVTGWWRKLIIEASTSHTVCMLWPNKLSSSRIYSIIYDAQLNYILVFIASFDGVCVTGQSIENALCTQHAMPFFMCIP